MPTSGLKNTLYRFALPFLAPSVPESPIAAAYGHPIFQKNSFLSVLRKNHISGAAIRIQSGPSYSSLFTKAFHTDRIPDQTTFFRVASITKMATALLAARLMDIGLLDPDSPVSDLLPDGKNIPDLAGIRFFHLLSHTSGLTDPPGLEAILLSQKPYQTALKGSRRNDPGAVFHYSNLGFGLIGSIFEALLNQSVEQVFHQFCFEPLGINATLEASSLPDHRIMPVVRIMPYHPENAILRTSLGNLPVHFPDPEYHYGYTAGSMYIDLPSLATLTSCVRDGGFPLLSPAYAGYMKKEKGTYGSVSPTLSYGSGLLIVRDSRISDSVLYGHQGFAYGCADGVFWEESTGNLFISMNGGASEARSGRFGLVNLHLCRWAFREELPRWN